MNLACFKAYDIRGRLGDELNEEIAYRVGRAFAQYLDAKRVAIGGDVRLSSESLKGALARGLMASGADVIDIGLSGTEEIYFAASHLDVDGAIEVTASHNPRDYNGMKLVGRGAKPISRDSGLEAIAERVAGNQFRPSSRHGTYEKQSVLDPYADHLLSYVDLSAIEPLTLVVNGGNGAAGPVVDAVESRFKAAGVPITFIKLHHQPDGTFPHGVPNPLLPENRAETAAAVVAHGAHLGIAWDGDFDRCFFFDGQGRYIEGYYIVGLLAEALLAKHPAGEKIVHDARLTWNTDEQVSAAGGIPVQSKSGHAFMKESMRREEALFGGEMSGHYFFRDFAYCDSGMIPWLLVVELVSRSGKPLSQWVAQRVRAYPCSGEINYTVTDIDAALRRVGEHYAPLKPIADMTDGLSLDFGRWRLNLRGSNTEPLLRLNVESKGDQELVAEKVSEVASIIRGL